MYQDLKFAPKKEVILDDGRIFYLGERVSMYGTRGITECCAIYSVLKNTIDEEEAVANNTIDEEEAVANNTIEAWVFTKSEDGKWKSMPNISDKGPQIYFSDKK